MAEDDRTSILAIPRRRLPPRAAPRRTHYVINYGLFAGDDARAAVAALVTFVAVFVACVGLAGAERRTQTNNRPDLQYCSFFNNRAPSAQSSLKNCTWFKERSCCLQQEIEETFGHVKSLQGSSTDCQRYSNYLMCYICSPDQASFYQSERLTVCRTFCDNWYEACNSAILKGSVIRELYSNGREFCVSRHFKVAQNENCFRFDTSLDKSAAAATKSPSSIALLFVLSTSMLMRYSVQ